MNDACDCASRRFTLLAINLLFLMVWGFSSTGKVLAGVPPWFGEKFGKTFFATFPGLAPTFWLLTASEAAAFLLAAIALLRFEFLRCPREPRVLTATIVWSLFVFLQLGFGQFVLSDFTGTFQQFVYFGVTLVALQVTGSARGAREPAPGS